MTSTFGSFIREARRSRGLTQAELADIVGIRQPNLSAYENDRKAPTAEVLNRIVVACGYLLEARAGDAVIRCPFPAVFDGPSAPAPRSGPRRMPRSPEESAVILEQVLALADTLRWSKEIG